MDKKIEVIEIIDEWTRSIAFSHAYADAKIVSILEIINSVGLCNNDKKILNIINTLYCKSGVYPSYDSYMRSIKEIKDLIIMSE